MANQCLKSRKIAELVKDFVDSLWTGTTKMTGPHINSRIRGSSTQTIQASETNKTTKPTIYPHNPKQYGLKAQYVEDEDKSALLGKQNKKFIQEVTGTFLFYARAVDTTMLTALS
jgi:hypothetical protein